MADISIYGLLDSKGVVRYIGKTKNCIQARLRQHKRTKDWAIKVKLLEICDEKVWKRQESFWIGYFQANGLVNKNDGGGGVKHVCTALRKQIARNTSKAIKQWHKDMPKELKEKRRQNLLGKNKGKKHPNRKKPPNFSLEHREKLRQAALHQWSNRS